ncbi:MAG: YncE family protein [Gammaproteobacteria bacterium]
MVRYAEGALHVHDIQSVAADNGMTPPPVFLGTTSEDKVIVMDAESKSISLRDTYPAAAFAPYAYRDPDAAHVWFTIDGDKETGCDTLNCGTTGSSVMVLDAAPGGEAAALLKVICVGRGHHVVTFTAPSQVFPDIPRRAFVSNLLDGTISVVGNDAAEQDSYLQVIDTINLCEPEREKDGASAVPNNAFPHGKVFSSRTGRIYSLNNGYGTIAVINPLNHRIEQRIELKVSSNLLLSPDGRFLIGKGADRKSDAEHVLGRLSVVDALSGGVATVLDLPDLYPSTYRFSPDGSKLYVTSAATGKGTQRDNLRIDVLQVYDAAALPALSLLAEIPVGRADCGRRPIAFIKNGHGASLVLVPNPSDGTISLLDGDSDTVLETATISDRPIKEFNFSFWDGAVSGC